MLSQDEGVAEIFVVGGSSLYDMSMDKYKEYCKLIIATRIIKFFECDTFISKNLEIKVYFIINVLLQNIHYIFIV
jgi:dihydrofolate reductase